VSRLTPSRFQMTISDRYVVHSVRAASVATYRLICCRVSPYTALPAFYDPVRLAIRHVSGVCALWEDAVQLGPPTYVASSHPAILAAIYRDALFVRG
jgi:hypothetical protein